MYLRACKVAAYPIATAAALAPATAAPVGTVPIIDDEEKEEVGTMMLDATGTDDDDDGRDDDGRDINRRRTRRGWTLARMGYATVADGGCYRRGRDLISTGSRLDVVADGEGSSSGPVLIVYHRITQQPTKNIMQCTFIVFVLLNRL